MPNVGSWPMTGRGTAFHRSTGLGSVDVSSRSRREPIWRRARREKRGLVIPNKRRVTQPCVKRAPATRLVTKRQQTLGTICFFSGELPCICVGYAESAPSIRCSWKRGADRSMRVLLMCFLLLNLNGCSSLLFYPEPGLPFTPQVAGLEFRDVTLVAADGTRLHGWWLPAKAGVPVK